MRKLRIALSGIGNRALPKNPKNSNWFGWVELFKRSGRFDLVAAHDVADDPIKRLVERGYLAPDRAYKDLDNMLDEVECDALLVANPAPYHARTIKKALERNLHVLVEKPFVNTLQDGRELVGLMKEKSRVVQVVQNWRFKDVGRLLFKAVHEGMIGKPGHIFFRYIRNRENPNYPSYIFEEKYPLLYAMGIHHLDLFRYILKDEFKSVSGRSFKAPWSLYKHATGLNLFLETQGGVTIVYSGTISSKNKTFPQESLVIEGEKGALVNDSQWLEPPLWFYPRDGEKAIELTEKIKERSIMEQYNTADEYILQNFYKAVTEGAEPVSTALDSLQSIRILEASREACETAETVFLERI